MGFDSRSKAMVTVKSSQKIFTDSEIACLTGICVEHVHNFAKTRHLGLFACAAEAAGLNADQWLFTLSDLMVLVTLFPKFSHYASKTRQIRGFCGSLTRLESH